jgi:protease-4
VQSAIIHDRIVALRAEHPQKRIVAVATDTVASGAYFVAAAADKIYVSRSTITGPAFGSGAGGDLLPLGHNKRDALPSGGR